MSQPSRVPTARILAIVLILGGAMLMVIAVFADQLGIGGGGEGFGWKQLIAAIAGLMILLAGVAWLLRPLTVVESDESPEWDGNDATRMRSQGSESR
jgi:hypothetical protein